MKLEAIQKQTLKHVSDINCYPHGEFNIKEHLTLRHQSFRIQCIDFSRRIVLYHLNMYKFDVCG
jgi:hypothetical protein